MCGEVWCGKIRYIVEGLRRFGGMKRGQLAEEGKRQETRFVSKRQFSVLGVRLNPCFGILSLLSFSSVS